MEIKIITINTYISIGDVAVMSWTGNSEDGRHYSMSSGPDTRLQLQAWNASRIVPLRVLSRRAS
jgi:hypothetical protein